MRQLVLKHVLAATDLTPASADALAAAAALARLAGARLHVLHASRDDPDAEGTLREHVARAAPAARDAALLAPAGAPHEVILQAAERVEADVMVLGPHRHRDGGPLGSTADRVVRGANVPCLIVPGPLDLPLGQVVAAVDLSDGGKGALLVALSWASALRRPGISLNGGEPGTRVDALHVVSAADDPPPRHLTSLAEYVATVRGALGAAAGVEIEQVVRGGGESPARVARTVMRHAAERGAGLLVIGTRDQAPPGSHPLGSVSSSVVQETEVAVLLVPPAVSRRAVEAPAANTAS